MVQPGSPTCTLMWAMQVHPYWQRSFPLLFLEVVIEVHENGCCAQQHLYDRED